MYKSNNFSQSNESTFVIDIGNTKDYKILQLTDLHLGFGLFSTRKDRQALQAMEELIRRTQPDIIMLTGDSIYPFWPQSGTNNNEKEASMLMSFLDGFCIPYAFVMGNHDTETGSKLDRKQLGELLKDGVYSIFTAGEASLTGVGNYMIELRREGRLQKVLCCLDSNMYVTKWFYDGFDRIHPDQTSWCMERLDAYRRETPDVEALAFFHMPLPEFKEGYNLMKLGTGEAVYHFGTISEEDDYFGISCLPGDFFEEAVQNGVIKYMFCGHDHLNNLSMTYKGIRMTYGMSIDCLGYRGIDKHQVQRGATEIVIGTDGDVSIRPVPLAEFVTDRVRGAKNN